MTVPKMKYLFRAIGPGIDLAEWTDAGSEIDDIIMRVVLAGEKLKRDALRKSQPDEIGCHRDEAMTPPLQPLERQ